MQTRLTIIIPCHNGATLLPAALNAALRQTAGNFEVILVDNASRDGTHRVALEFAARDERLNVLRRETSDGGPAAARACGAEAARGDLLWFLDADDVPRADVAARAIAELARHPEAGSLALGIELIDRLGQGTGEPGG